MASTWDTFEKAVRQMALFIWGQECRARNIGGVDLDGVIELSEDIWVFIEITERKDLQKVREDIVKLRTAKMSLLASHNVFARCYCVLEGNVTQAMLDAAAPHKINVISIEGFSKIFYDFETYRVARLNSPFGSAVSPITGKKDDSAYVPVTYINAKSGDLLNTTQIAKLISEGKRIVLLGEYGSGKSRCFREVFKLMAEHAAKDFAYPVAIDLRESWGLRRGAEILDRHLTELGVADTLRSSAMRALNSGKLCLLLDGFDEIGSQAWSNDTEKLRAIRAKSLEGAKDFISRSQSGVLVSGREHYFNNNEEMMNALGLDDKDTIVLRCKEEFSDSEATEFFKRISTDIAVPDWLPRRPLICQTIADLSEDEIDEMFGVGENELEFWDHFIKTLCQRDARIHHSFDATTIELVLSRLARLTRSRSTNVGPITLADVQSAFETVVGQMPVEDASVMLQRLPGLGRVKAESNDRQFIDVYILDGLRAKDTADLGKMDDHSQRQIYSARFINPLGELGQRLLNYSTSDKSKDFINYASKASAAGNNVLASDIVASTLINVGESLDFKGLFIDDGHFIRCDLSKSVIYNLHFMNSVFGELVLPSSPPRDTTIKNCLASRVYGVSTGSALPAWIENLTSDQFDSVESVSRIRKIGLEPRFEVLIAIIRKTFFQKGSGRKEEALLRGLNKVMTSGEANKIVNLLLREHILERHKGNEGWIYSPVRSQTGRMKQMLYELKTSQDSIWLEVGKI